MSLNSPSPNIAVLCPGESLARWSLADLPRAGPVVCVNRAILRGVELVEPARLVWVWLDPVYFLSQLAAAPSLAPVPILTLQSRLDNLRRNQRLALSTIWQDKPSEKTPGLFTLTYALRYALSTPAPEVHLYGVDQVPGADWDGGEPVGACRTPERWERERLQIRPLMSPRVVFHR